MRLFATAVVMVGIFVAGVVALSHILGSFAAIGTPQLVVIVAVVAIAEVLGVRRWRRRSRPH